MLKKCEYCGKEFETKKASCCSPKCYKAAWYAKNRKTQPKAAKCPICGKEFVSRYGKQYCSISCRRKAYYSKPVFKKCLICGKEFEISRGRKYCSAECSSIARHRDKKPHALKYDVVCPVCGKEFVSASPHKLYCSSRCAKAVRNQRARVAHQQQVQKETRKCPVCGKEFVAKQKRSRFCSASCRNKLYNETQKLKRMQAWVGKELGRMEIAERRRATIEARLTQAEQEMRQKVLAENEKVRAQIRAFVESRVAQ